MAVNKHGGARVKSGRKPIEDKAVTLTVYPKASRINKIGIERVKILCIEAIEKEFQSILKKS